MFCRKCGLKNDDDAVFCKLCGARLSEEEVEQLSEGTLSLSSTPPVPNESVVGNKTVATKEAKALKPKKKLHLHFFICLLLAFLIGSSGTWIYLQFFKKITIPLDEYVKVNIHGPSGYAVAGTEIDWDGIERDYGGKLSFTQLAKSKGLEELYHSPITCLFESISPPSLKKEKNIKNGDLIAYQWNFDDREIIRYLNCKLKLENKKIKAHTDASVKEEDIFGKMEIKAVGNNGYGKIVLRALPEGLKKDDFIIYSNFFLSNGSKVDIDLRYSPLYYYESCGILPSKKNITYTVSGLKETSEEKDTAIGTEDSSMPFSTAEDDARTEEAKAQYAVSDYICPYSSFRLITKQDMTELMAEYPKDLFPGQRSLAQMIINEIYARYGYEFKDPELNDYFEQFYWYSSLRDRISNVDNIYRQMSEIEKKNVEFLKTYP